MWETNEKIDNDLDMIDTQREGNLHYTIQSVVHNIPED